MNCHNCRKGISRIDAIVLNGHYYCKECAKEENRYKIAKTHISSVYGKNVNELKNHLTKVRIDSGLSQKALAERIGTDQAKISRVENGKFSCYDILNWYYHHGTTYAVFGGLEDGETNITSTKGIEH